MDELQQVNGINSSVITTEIHVDEEHLRDEHIRDEHATDEQVHDVHQVQQDQGHDDNFAEIEFANRDLMSQEQITFAQNEMRQLKVRYDAYIRDRDMNGALLMVRNADIMRRQYEHPAAIVIKVRDEAFEGFDTTTKPRAADTVELPQEQRHGWEKTQKRRLKKLREKEKKKEDALVKQKYEKMKPISINDKKSPQEREKIDPELIRTAWMKDNILKKKSDTGETQEVLMRKVMNGDYSHMEQMDPVLRNILAERYIKSFQMSGDPAGVVEMLVGQGGIKAIMNPLLRLGISLGQQGRIAGGRPFEYYHKLDEAMNTKIMGTTITHVPDQTKLRAAYGQGPEGDNTLQADLLRNQQSQLFMAKTMLIAQLGSFKLTSKSGDSTDWTGTMANAFAHCSRVTFTLPAPVEKGAVTTQPTLRRMVDSYTGTDGGLQAGFFKRGGATHSLERKRRKPGSAPLKEKKTLVTLSNQQGMNVAVGGLGNDGIPGEGGQNRMLKNDGSCGHIYVHRKEGDSSKYTGLLVGFESDSYKTTNQLGHTHGFGNGEFASSFGGQRIDEIGAKIGGRSVDLSSMDAYVFEKVMSGFSAWFTNQQAQPVNSAERRMFEGWVNKLCGAKMSGEEMKSFLKDEVHVNDPSNPNFSDVLDHALQ